VIHTLRLETADGIETFNVKVRKRDDGLEPYLADCTTMFKWYSQRGNTYQEALLNVLNTIVQSVEFEEEI
jgi:hypothetical protein